MRKINLGQIIKPSAVQYSTVQTSVKSLCDGGAAQYLGCDMVGRLLLEN